MYINTLKIENFKGFKGGDHEIHFNIPDQINKGSGLNIFVGNNNSGKSTVLESFNFLKEGSKKTIDKLLNRNSIEKNFSIEIELISDDFFSVIDNHIQANKVDIFKKHLIDDKALKVRRQYISTNDEEIKKILFLNKNSKKFENVSGIDAPFKKLYDNNFIWADTNPTDETKFGASTLCGYLLKEIASKHVNTQEYLDFEGMFNNIFNKTTSELRQKIKILENDLNDILLNQFGSTTIEFDFPFLDIENFFKTSTLIASDNIHSNIELSEKGHGFQRAVALALLQVYANSISTVGQVVPKPFFIFIDEPEICLHPKGQKKLLEALMELSKYQQVFITTHSPFMLSHLDITNTGIFIFDHNSDGNYIVPAKLNKVFKWSPSWGEINYKAYKIATIDFHNELYGFLYKKSGASGQKQFDIWLNDKFQISINKIWSKAVIDSKSKKLKIKPQNSTNMTYVRNCIHHPENVGIENIMYTPEDLENTIAEMLFIMENYFPVTE